MVKTSCLFQGSKGSLTYLPYALMASTTPTALPLSIVKGVESAPVP